MLCLEIYFSVSRKVPWRMIVHRVGVNSVDDYARLRLKTYDLTLDSLLPLSNRLPRELVDFWQKCVIPKNIF